jgi:hypothetical protein
LPQFAAGIAAVWWMGLVRFAADCCGSVWAVAVLSGLPADL